MSNKKSNELSKMSKKMIDHLYQMSNTSAEDNLSDDVSEGKKIAEELNALMENSLVNHESIYYTLDEQIKSKWPSTSRISKFAAYHLEIMSHLDNFCDNEIGTKLYQIISLLNDKEALATPANTPKELSEMIVNTRNHFTPIDFANMIEKDCKKHISRNNSYSDTPEP